jgi:putative hydrolase of the HAD superfamily
MPTEHAKNGHHVRAVVFDVGGVIARQDIAAADRAFSRSGVLSDITAEAVARARANGDLTDIWAEHSCGRVSPDVYWSAVLVQLGKEPTVEAVAEMRRVQRMTLWSLVDTDVLDLAKSLRRNGAPRLGVLSNSSVDYEPHIDQFDGLFDVLQFSHQVGVRKPMEEAYEILLASMDVEATQTLFIDDKLRNVTAAARLGINAFHFVSTELLRDELARVGLLVPVTP